MRVDVSGSGMRMVEKKGRGTGRGGAVWKVRRLDKIVMLSSV